MTTYAVWWVLSLLLVIVELATGTFYVLMIALAFAVGGTVAFLGGALTVQFAIAAAVGWVSVWAVRRSRLAKRSQSLPSALDPMQSLDIGKTVHVKKWDDGTARVTHRGSTWDAVMADGEPTVTGALKIVEVRGTSLVLSTK